MCETLGLPEPTITWGERWRILANKWFQVRLINYNIKYRFTNAPYCKTAKFVAAKFRGLGAEINFVAGNFMGGHGKFSHLAD